MKIERYSINTHFPNILYLIIAITHVIYKPTHQSSLTYFHPYPPSSPFMIQNKSKINPCTKLSLSKDSTVRLDGKGVDVHIDIT